MSRFLIDSMEDARRRTLTLIDGLDAAQLMGPRLPVVNPLRWEIGHTAYFYEYWILRQHLGEKPVFDTVDAPFVGNGFTRWVDGQYALDKPELGLSNWQFGRLFGRGGVLSGDSAFTIRTRVTQDDPDIGR